MGCCRKLIIHEAAIKILDLPLLLLRGSLHCLELQELFKLSHLAALSTSTTPLLLAPGYLCLISSILIILTAIVTTPIIVIVINVINARLNWSRSPPVTRGHGCLALPGGTGEIAVKFARAFGDRLELRLPEGGKGLV
jgi:hypothetical protein